MTVYCNNKGFSEYFLKEFVNCNLMEMFAEKVYVQDLDLALLSLIRNTCMQREWQGYRKMFPGFQVAAGAPEEDDPDKSDDDDFSTETVDELEQRSLANTVDELEQRRQENMAKNKAMLQQLGINATIPPTKKDSRLLKRNRQDPRFVLYFFIRLFAEAHTDQYQMGTSLCKPLWDQAWSVTSVSEVPTIVNHLIQCNYTDDRYYASTAALCLFRCLQCLVMDNKRALDDVWLRLLGFCLKISDQIVRSVRQSLKDVTLGHLLLADIALQILDAYGNASSPGNWRQYSLVTQPKVHFSLMYIREAVGKPGTDRVQQVIVPVLQHVLFDIRFYRRPKDPLMKLDDLNLSDEENTALKAKLTTEYYKLNICLKTPIIARNFTQCY